jgi:hypothetical protein
MGEDGAIHAAIRRVNPDDEYYFKEGCFILELSNRIDYTVNFSARST